LKICGWRHKAEVGNILPVVIENKDIDEIDLQLKTLTPTKIYNRTRSDVTELIFPSPSSVCDTPKRTRINDIIYMPSSCSKKIVFTNDDTPRKIK